MDKRLINILCCPVSHTPLRRMQKKELGFVNQAIHGGDVQRVDGTIHATALADGLITVDGKVIYRIDDDIPVLLPEEGIGTTQFNDFPDV